MFLLVFNDGGFNELDTFLLSDHFDHTPKEVLAKNFNAPESTFDRVPKEKLYIFQAQEPRPLAEEQQQAARAPAATTKSFSFAPPPCSRPKRRPAAM